VISSSANSAIFPRLAAAVAGLPSPFHRLCSSLAALLAITSRRRYSVDMGDLSGVFMPANTAPSGLGRVSSIHWPFARSRRPIGPARRGNFDGLNLTPPNQSRLPAGTVSLGRTFLGGGHWATPVDVARNSAGRLQMKLNPASRAQSPGRESETDRRSAPIGAATPDGSAAWGIRSPAQDRPRRHLPFAGAPLEWRLRPL
jgi:hypothetical protein